LAVKFLHIPRYAPTNLPCSHKKIRRDLVDLFLSVTLTRVTVFARKPIVKVIGAMNPYKFKYYGYGLLMPQQSRMGPRRNF
jgi:hypothetical protein